MATKTNFITSVNTQLTAIITQLKHRASMLLMIDELFKTTIEDDQSTTNVFTALLPSSTILYEIKVSKTGNTVFVNGWVANNSANILPTNTKFLTITNAEYIQIESVDPFQLYRAVTDKNGKLLIFNFDNTISFFGALNPQERLFFNFSYKTIL